MQTMDGLWVGLSTDYNSIILHTTDGGTTWTQQWTGNKGVLYSVSFIDNNIGMAVGYRNTTGFDFEGFIVKTTNGGQDWEFQFSSSMRIFTGVSLSDINTV